MAATKGRQEADHLIEEEELDTAPMLAGTARAAGAGAGRSGGLGFFAIGALLMLAAVAALFVGFTNDYYEVDVRNGPQPNGDDNSDRIYLRIDLRGYEELRYDDGQGDPVRSSDDWADAELVGVVMQPLAWTGYVGVGLLALAFVSALLFRLGVLSVAGPAPIIALFGVVFLAAGLIGFILDIAHHVRLDWLPGRMDLPPRFWTSNADGDVFHDLYMNPLSGFWLHAAGTVAGAVGAVLLFWGEIRRVGKSVKRFVESSPLVEA